MAENLFLRKQLALHRKRNVKSRRGSDATRVALVLLARCLAWKEAFTAVRAEMLIRWHREGGRRPDSGAARLCGIMLTRCSRVTSVWR